MIRPLPLFAAALACCASPCLAAPEPTKAAAASQEQLDREAAADQLVAIMHLDRQFDAIIPQMVTLMMNSFLPGNVGHEDQVRTIIAEETNRAFKAHQGEFITLTRNLYANNFSAAELRDIIAFYSSPTGRKMLDTLPQIMSQAMSSGADVGRAAARDAIPRIAERLRAASLSVPKGI